MFHRIVLVCVGLALVPTGALAQSHNPADPFTHNEARVLGALTIPLGHATDNRRTSPRLEIISRSSLPKSDLAVVARDDQRRWNERRIGLTLTAKPSLMLNGEPINRSSHQVGISTGGAIAIGIGVLLVGAAITLADGVDAIEDLTDPD